MLLVTERFIALARAVRVGVILTLLVELGQITPPVGLNLFVIHSISGGHTFAEVAYGSIPYAVLVLLMILVVAIWPGPATWLPANLSASKENSAMSQADVHQLGQGLYFEDFPVGSKFRSVARTITESDLCAFLNVTHMDEAVFTDLEYAAAHSAMKGRVVPGALCYAFAEGLCITDTMQFTGMAFLNMELDMKGPTLVGDTIHVEIEVIEARPSKSNPDRGLVRTRNTVVKQDASVVLVYTPLRMVRCRGVQGA